MTSKHHASKTGSAIKGASHIMSIKACNNELTRFVEKKADERAPRVGPTSLLDPQVILQKEIRFVMAIHRIQVYSNPPLPSSVDQASFKTPFLANISISSPS